MCVALQGATVWRLWRSAIASQPLHIGDVDLAAVHRDQAVGLQLMQDA